MIIVREIFTCKPGMASKFAKIMKGSFMKGKSRVMTDLTGNYNTVVVESEMDSLADFDKMMEDYKSGKMDQDVDPEVAKQWEHYTDMYMTGRREIYQIW
ncbi:MAG: hypothetical protein HY336_00835 [Candidatus Doudnabacteria bacterium]|nr:hypothetical protein [Candidatus Doudnabacteria bacterium]